MVGITFPGNRGFRVFGFCDSLVTFYVTERSQLGRKLFLSGDFFPVDW
jgi:hypothetical protein